MSRLIMRWAIGVAAVAITVWLAGRIGLTLKWTSFWGMVAFVPVLAVVNAVVGPVLRLFSLPLSCLTFGLFGFVINAIVFWIAGAATGAEMTFLSALFGSIVVTLIATPMSIPFKEKD